MDSSFVVWINVSHALYAFFLFAKFAIQFGRPNHPMRLGAYLVFICLVSYLGMQAATDLSMISPWVWNRWRIIPLVAGGLCLLLQVITMVGRFSLIQQKIISRLPLIAALLSLAFFPTQANAFFTTTICMATIFLSFSLGKARYQKRQFFKMVLFLALFFGLRLLNTYGAYVIGDLLLFVSIFYFSVFEQSFGVASLVAEFDEKSLGEKA